MKLNILILLLTLLATASCNNSRNPRLNLSTVCDLEADIASFELLESEEDDFALVTGGLPTGKEYETTGFVITKEDGDITSSYIPVPRTLFSDEPTFGLICVNGFTLDQEVSGSFNFSVPILSEDQEMNEYNFSVDYDTERNNEDPVVNTQAPVLITPLSGVDILAALTNLGFEVNLYTPSEGDDQNTIFSAHARNLTDGLTLRLQISVVEE